MVDTYELSIRVDDVEVISYCPYELMSFEDYTNQVSYFSFTIENPSGVTPAKMQTVLIYSSAGIIFDGYIVEVKTRKRDNGITTEYDIEAADKKILLEKSVLTQAEFTGTDSAILSALLTATYPDLTDTFDFSTDITSFLSDMAMLVNEISLLDALNELADLAGGAAFRFETVGVVNFETNSMIYTLPGPQVGTVQGSVGNPGSALRSTSFLANEYISILLTFDIPIKFIKVTWDFYQDSASSYRIYWNGDLLTSAGLGATVDQWVTKSREFGAPISASTIELRLIGGVAVNDLRMDNVKINDGAVSTGNHLDNLRWDSIPDAGDFDLDIQSGDEFASEIDFFTGSPEDFNSITVIGGSKDTAVDWTYESRGDMNHFDLEAHVKDIVIYKNTNIDGSPTWTVQTAGEYGVDELTVDGGSKDVLYDATDHWLLFNSNPSDLSKSIRVTGTIQKPIRIRVEDVGAGEPTFATTYYNESVQTEDEAVAVGLARLERSNAIKRITFKTHDPVFKVGQSIDIDDSARGINETLTITKITTKWLGASGHAEFIVECGENDIVGADLLIANNDKRSRKNSVASTAVTLTVTTLFDADGTTALTDTDGRRLYEGA